MLSFHNDPAVKEKYVARILQHQKMDNIIQGTGWRNGKGCAVGCILENYDHSRYPMELGLPEWLARLQDDIFENLPTGEAKLWPHKSLSAIPVGVDIEPLKHKLSILRLNRLIDIQENLLEKNQNLKEVFLQVINAIKLVKQCHESELNKNSCDWKAAKKAGESAESAARAAWVARAAAGDSAREAAWAACAAECAACAAESATWATESASCAAESAACSAAKAAAESAARAAARAAVRAAARAAVESSRSAAWEAAWQQQAADLINLLKEMSA